MTYSDAIQFLYDLRLFGTKLGLENTFKLAALAGNPQERLRFIHVAGTNGKGSTCAMLESIYRAAGLRVGLFTSPHLISFRERIQVNRQLISESDVVRLVEELREPGRTGVAPAQESERGFPSRSTHAADKSRRIPMSSSHRECCGLQSRAPMDRRDACPTFFEFVTVMALKYFAEQKCDLVIWETGLGGRLDATNIVTPLASVITNVALDHQQWLGDTLAKIAGEKAGIIKPGVPVVTTANSPEALAIISEAAKHNQSRLKLVTEADTRRPPLDTVSLPLLGEHQRLNAALAVATVRVLSEKIPVNENAMRAGLANVRWAGRLQAVHRAKQTWLLDGAHNLAAVEALRTTLQQEFPNEPATLVLGVMRDKDWPQMCRVLAPLARRIVLTRMNTDRSASPAKLVEPCRVANPAAEIIACESFGDAVSRVASDSFVLVTGSLYLVGEAIDFLPLGEAHSNEERALNEWQTTR